MNAAELKSLQAPVKERYRQEPKAALQSHFEPKEKSAKA